MTAPDRFPPPPAPPRRVVVATSCDDGYARHAAVSLASLARRLDPARPAELWLIDCGVAPENLARIRAAVARARPGAAFRTLRPQDVRLPRPVAGPERLHRPAVLMRLLLAELMPREVERLLYIDADTVTREDVGSLFDMDMEGRALWAVEDLAAGVEIDRLERDPRAPRFPDRRAYFNGGVLLMDLARWRARRLGPRALAAVTTMPHLVKLADQDALNLVLAGDFGVLPHRWNNQIRGRRALRPDLLGPAAGGVLHWAGRRKPWDRGHACLREAAYARELLRLGWLAPAEARALRLARGADLARHLARRLAARLAAAARAPAASPQPGARAVRLDA